MVFHWWLSNSKCPQVFRTLLSILGDLNNTVVSTRSLISKSPCPCTNPITTSLSCSIAFLVLEQNLDSYFYFRFPSVFSCRQPDQLSPQFGRFSFFWLSQGLSFRRNWVIRLYVKILEKFVHLILWDRFRVVLIPFVLSVNFKLLAQFSVDPLSHPIL